MSNEEEFKLPLRHWLKKQVDSGKYYGLEWYEATIEGNQKKYIKIPWIQQHYPNWERSYELFVAWATHKGSYTEPPNYKKLKGNFRCAMRKSNDFKEVESQEDLQKGNYKLYELRDKEAVTELKRRQQQQKHTPTNKKPKLEQPSPLQYSDPWHQHQPTPTANLFSQPYPQTGLTHLDIAPPDMFAPSSGDVAEVLRVPRAEVPEMWRRKSSHSSGSDGTSELNPIGNGDCEEFKNKFVEEVEEFVQRRNCSPHSASTYSPCSGISEEIAVGIDQYFVTPTPCYQQGGINMMPSPPITAPSTGGYMKPSPYHQTPNTSPYHVQPSNKLAIICKMMENYHFSIGVLPHFNMRLFYDDKLVLEHKLDLTMKANYNGCRLFYGDVNEHRRVFETSNKQEMLYYQNVQIPPPYPGMNQTISKILDTFQQGVALEYDPNEAVLRLKRHCRTAVFFIESESAKELKRLECIKIFDYHESLSKYMTRQKTSHMQCELVIGTKPHRNKLIKLKLRPQLATTLVPLSYNGSITSNTDLVSCCMDQPDSLDRQLEKLKI